MSHHDCGQAGSEVLAAACRRTSACPLPPCSECSEPSDEHRHRFVVGLFVLFAETWTISNLSESELGANSSEKELDRLSERVQKVQKAR